MSTKENAIIARAKRRKKWWAENKDIFGLLNALLSVLFWFPIDFFIEWWFH